MPYQSWNQFRRQRSSLGLPANAQEYANRPLIHSKWPNHTTFDPADVPLLGGFPAWVLNHGGVVTITLAGVPQDLLDGLRNYGAMLESIIPRQPRIIRPSAGGTVLYDRARDRLYYGASRYLPALAIHATLIARVQQLPLVQGHGGAMVNTLVGTRHAHTCAEFQALNLALFDGAQEQNLELWCFKAATMEPFPRCGNCRVTVPQKGLARIWTC
jgi:hypothetical protein